MGWDRGGTNSTWAITSGTGVNGTNSLEDSPKRNYRSNTHSWAGYMTPITSVKDNLYTLSFKWKGIIETNYDYLDINYSTDGVNWDWLDYRTGSTGGSFISDSTEEITIAADFFSSFYFGFGLYSDNIFNYDGVYIDDVVLTRESITISGYGYTSYQGTSMAAPHVSGVAGLIKSLNPGLTNLEIIDTILNNVDVKSSLNGEVLTGGRLNAYEALNSVSCPNLPVRILNTGAEFSTLQAAYNAADSGYTIMSRAVVFTEDLNINLNKSVTLEGGYNCNYTDNSAYTILNGIMTVSNGMITPENLILE